MSLSKRDIFTQHLAQTSTYPLALEVVKAEGVFIFDNTGKKYYDLNSGISVSSLGHRHLNQKGGNYKPRVSNDFIKTVCVEKGKQQKNHIYQD